MLPLMTHGVDSDVNERLRKLLLQDLKKVALGGGRSDAVKSRRVGPALSERVYRCVCGARRPTMCSRPARERVSMGAFGGLGPRDGVGVKHAAGGCDRLVTLCDIDRGTTLYLPAIQCR